MLKKILIAVGCLVVVAVAVLASPAWKTYQNKQRFDATLAEYKKDQAAQR